jgi:hypothetical protein
MITVDADNTRNARPSVQDCLKAVKALFDQGQVVELRALGRRYTVSGYYDNLEALASDAVRLSSNPEFEGVYWTIQQLNPALLARSPNAYIERARTTTSDPDVTAFIWLPIDLDPVRPAGISSSEQEKTRAFQKAKDVLAFLQQEFGNPHIVWADSGNGYHLLVKIAALPSSDKQLISRVLETLSQKFTDDHVKVDRTMFNPARILKAYGTVARKGANTAERPHRATEVRHILNEGAAPVSREALEKIAAEAKDEPKKKGQKNEAVNIEELASRLEAYLKEAQLECPHKQVWNGGLLWGLARCPFNDSHTGCSTVSVDATGRLGFQCHHNSCVENHWPEFRAFLEEKLGRKLQFTEHPATAPPTGIDASPGKVKEMVKQSETVLHGIGLKYFERNSELVHTAYGRELKSKNAISKITRDDASVVIRHASAETITRDLDSLTSYFTIGEKGKPISVHVPWSVPRQIHDRVRNEPRDVPFPTLEMVTSSPVLLPSGRVHTQIFEEGVMFVNHGQNVFPAIPEAPSKEEARTALDLFDSIFSKFPFIDESTQKDATWEERKRTSSYAGVLASVMSLVARPFFNRGGVPLIAYTAPARRSGKTLLAEAACGAALGHKPTTVSFVDEGEFGKHLQPLMRHGDRAVLIDNLERPLQSMKLNILLTGGVLQDRVLGESRDVTLTNHAVFFVTGNNLSIGGDLTARSIRIDINAEVERPESRTFDFNPYDRAVELHPQLASAAILALRAFIVAGMPWTPKRPLWGDPFVRWDSLISGCLTWLGYGDPFTTRDRVIEDDPIREKNADLLELVFNRFKNRVFQIRELREVAEVAELLHKDGGWDGYHVRWVLKKMENQIINGYCLKRCEGGSKFMVVKTEQERLEF